MKTDHDSNNYNSNDNNNTQENYANINLMEEQIINFEENVALFYSSFKENIYQDTIDKISKL